MRKLAAHSRSSLFLMEMILSILILALTSTACVRIFAAAKVLRQEARELNHIQALTTSAGEALEGWDGQTASFIQIFGNPVSSEDNLLKYCYDKEWNSCTESSAEYILTIQLGTSQIEKTAKFSFYDSDRNQLYQLSAAFPFTQRKDELS